MLKDSSVSAFVSVIVPVYNDAARLRLCLQALAAQTYAKQFSLETNGASECRASECRVSEYEVIVVDNGSDAAENIAALTAEFPFVVYAYEGVPGAYAARNRGLEMARGEVLAFTDADCIPATDWLEKGLRYLQQVPNCGLVAGRVTLFFQGDRANSIELYESVTAFPQQRLLTQQRGAATANVFTLRSVINAVGPFNAKLKSQGDLEWGRRVYEAGYAQVYAHDLCVAHPARHTWAQLYRRTKRLAGGAFGRLMDVQDKTLQDATWQSKTLTRHWQFVRLLLEDLLPPVNFTLSVLKDSRLKGLRAKLTVPLVLVWVRCISAVEKLRLRFGGVPYRG